MAPASLFSNDNSPALLPIGTPSRARAQPVQYSNEPSGRHTSNSISDSTNLWARIEESLQHDRAKQHLIEVRSGGPPQVASLVDLGRNL